MCRSMVDIQSVAAEIRRGIKKKIEEEDRKKLQGKNIMAPLLHRAAIKSKRAQRPLALQFTEQIQQYTVDDMSMSYANIT